ncbi:MAG: rRNA maturation protein [Archaeoglobaceae archaeon]|nr:rRNA maturation protein [Archaeoglobaceae archaeon]MDW7989235.1 rRNA maturation protein [Archaeoglobaceae archaeon]
MILTTSRKPGRKTRSFAKIFSRFLGWKYIRRGKLSLRELKMGQICMILEIKGNPAVMSFFKNGIKTLEILFSVSNVKKIEISDGAVLFFGDKYNFFHAIPKKLIEKFDKKPYFEKIIVEKDDELLFYFKKQLLFKIRLLKVKQIQQNL